MANPIGLNGTHYRQERYADAIKKLYRKPTFIRDWFNKDYEGNPVAGAVNVPVRDTDVSLSTYDVASGISLNTSATTYEQVLIDGHKACNELIDGYEAQAVPDNLVAQRMESAGYVFGMTLEKDAINQLVTNGTTASSTVASTTDTIYANVVAEITALKKLGITTDRIKVVVSADTEALLLSDAKFANTSGNLGAELVRQGVIGKINGCEVKMSPVLDEYDNLEFIVFAQDYVYAIDEWKVAPSVVDLKDGKHIGASALQGRIIFKDYVARATAVRVKTSGSVVSL